MPLTIEKLNSLTRMTEIPIRKRLNLNTADGYHEPKTT
jgi:hypothetical protein